jgi:hypothetical protein
LAKSQVENFAPRDWPRDAADLFFVGRDFVPFRPTVFLEAVFEVFFFIFFAHSVFSA